MSHLIDPRWGSYSSLGELLTTRACEEGESPAYTFLADGTVEGQRQELTFAGLERRARAIAAALLAKGLSGERALLLFPPGIDFVAAFFGCLHAGVVAVPAYPPGSKRKLPRLAAIAADAQPRVVLTTEALRDKLSALTARLPQLASTAWLATDALLDAAEQGAQPAQPAIGPDTVAFLQYTSGSTSTPKGVMVTQGNLLHNEEMIRLAFGHDRRSTVVGWLPLYHDMGLIGNLLQPLYLGTHAVLMSPIAFLQQPRRWLQTISHFRATTSGGPNFAYDLCVARIAPEERSGLDLSSWQVAFNGAEPVRAQTLRRFTDAFSACGFRGRSFYPCYGLAEATLLVSAGDPACEPRIRRVDAASLEQGRVKDAPSGATAEEARTLVSCGRPWQEQRIAIVDPATGAPLPADSIGEIWVAGPSVAAGYWRRDEQTRRDFNTRLPDETAAFLRTGDLGFVAEGELYVTGRSKDLIIIRGRNIYPQDVEWGAELAHPALRRGCSAAFVQEAESDQGGERLVVVQEIDRRRESAAAEAAAAIRVTVAAEHDIQPESVVIVRAGEVPKTSSGKVQRDLCRRLLLAEDLKVLARDSLARSAAGPSSRGAIGWDDAAQALRALPDHQRLAAMSELLAGEVSAAARVDRGAVAIDRPLTALGLDSLAAIELQHSLSNLLGVRPSLGELVDGSTVADLATLMLARWEELSSRPEGSSATATASAGDRATTGLADWELADLGPTATGPTVGEQPVSSGQRALWLLARLVPDNPAYNLVAAARVEGELDVEALRSAFTGLLRRHAALRACFPNHGGEPVMRVGEEPVFELALLSGDEGEPEANLLAAAQFAYKPFDIASGPLVRVGVQQLGRGRRLILAVHHLVADFWSLAVIMRDLSLLYAQACEGGSAGGAQASDPPALLRVEPLRFSDWVRWQQDERHQQQRARDLEFWRRQLDGIAALDLPVDHPRPPLRSYRGGRVVARLPADLAATVRSAAAGGATTPYAVLLAAFQAQLARYSGQSRFSVGSPTSGRGAEGVSEVVGYFVNPVAMVADLRQESARSPLTTRAFLARTRATALAAFEHQELPLQDLAEQIETDRDASRSPLFQVMFTFQRPHLRGSEALAAAALGAQGYPIEFGELTLHSESLPEQGTPFDLALTAAQLPARQEPGGEQAGGEGGGELGLALQYSRDLYDPATAERMLGHYATLLRALVTDLAGGGRGALERLPLLSAAERGQLLAEWVMPATLEVPAVTLVDLVAASVRRHPDRWAVVSLNGQVTFAQLEERSNRLAHALRRLGVGPEQRVAVMLPRTPGLIVALLAVLKAGAAYAPIDPAYPAERRGFILEDCQPRVILCQSTLADSVPFDQRARTLLLDIEAERLDRFPATAPKSSAGVRNLAYLIYTSGSTGRPKGVAIEHASAVAMISWARTVFSEAELAGVLAATSVCFDLSVFEIFLPLASGGTLLLVDDALVLTSPRAPELTAQCPLTLINTVPSAITVLEELAAIPESVVTVNLAGEPLKGDLVRRIHASAPAVGRVLNLYGPSEDTTYSTWWSSADEPSRARLDSGEEPTIGVPIANSRGYVLDGRMRLAPVGVPGLLYLGGGGLARGYFDRPALTAERWLPDPFAGVASGSGPGSRIYATGDLVRWLPEGQLEFLGRADHQVKIRGFRIELGEIEVALAAHRAVSEAVVTAGRTAADERRLVGYWVGESGVEADGEMLRRYLAGRLPEYMVPSVLVELPALPQTPNGKIDRRALPAPDATAEKERVTPRTPLEEHLALIWSAVLGVERVGVHDHFFELGGHSLLASRVVARIHSEIGVELELAQLFSAPTVATLAERVEEGLVLNSDSAALEELLAAMEGELAEGGEGGAQRRMQSGTQADPGRSPR